MSLTSPATPIEHALTPGQRIAAARKNLGYSGAQLARRMGVDSATLRRWESDRAEPRANRVVNLAGLLNVSVSWLLTGRGEGPAPGLPGAELRSLASTLAESRAACDAVAAALARCEARLRELGA